MKKHLCKIEYPFEFNNNYVLAHFKQMEELKKILENSGYKKEFIIKFRNRLKFLVDRKKWCYQKNDWFEELKGNSQFSSMRVSGNKNIRILFTFCNQGLKEHAVLLVSFEEKRTKDYKTHIEIAKDRLKELNEWKELL